MTAWPFRSSAIDVVTAIAFLALVLALLWAAIERGRAHRWCRRLYEFTERDLRLPKWCAAVGTVAGCA
ncbi:MAG TPA: hypothetical protein VFO19_09195 [Vicinamibacterales bacterium]|nr:hypothetical protein [Vicinamibacterales bacterium]